MSKWLSIELSLLLFVSLVAFAGLFSMQSSDNDLTGELSLYKPPRPQPPVYVPPQQPVQQGELNLKSNQPAIIMDAGNEHRYQLWVDKSGFNIWNSALARGKFSIGPKGDITSTYLSGKGNAYVCANEAGFMYRSETPCK